MFPTAKSPLWCIFVLAMMRPVSGYPGSGPAITLDVTPVSGSGASLKPTAASCSLDARLTPMEKVTALALFASRPYGKADEFDLLVTIDIWTPEPQLMDGIEATDVNVHGKIGAGLSSKSQLALSWKYPRNDQVRQYRCVANGLDGSGRVVTISITSDSAPPGQSRPGEVSRDNIRLLAKTVSSMLTNSTAELEDSVETIGADVQVLKETVGSLENSVKTQASTIADLQDRVNSLTDLYKFTYVMSNFDVSNIFNGKRYYVSKTVAPFNIQAADTLCAMLDGYLVEVDDVDEFNFVFGYVKHVGGTYYFFTGANDIAQEGVWRFWHSKKPVTFFKWGHPTRQPDNAGNNEDCMELRLTLGGFNDWICNEKGKFVCEVSA